MLKQGFKHGKKLNTNGIDCGFSPWDIGEHHVKFLF
jgi:hypothetical protein